MVERNDCPRVAPWTEPGLQASFTLSGRLMTPLSGRLSTTADSLFFLDFTFNIQDIGVFINDILDPLASRLKSPI